MSKYNIILSITLGMVIGIGVYKIIFPTIYHGPNSKDIVNKIFKVDNKYYKLVPQIIN